MRIPKITWGTSFANTLTMAYPLDNAQPYPEPRDGSEWAEAVSGVRDAWITGTNQFLEGDVRWIPGTDTTAPVATGWDTALTGWNAFLQWAWQANAFNWYPDANLCAHWATVGDGSWTLGGTPVRVAHNVYANGIPLDFIQDDDAGTTEGCWRAIPFTGNGDKVVSFVIHKEAAYASTKVHLRSTTGPTDRLTLNIDNTGSTPAVTASVGTLLSVIAVGIGYRITAKAVGVVATENNLFVLYPAGAAASDLADLDIGDIHAWDDDSPWHTSSPTGAPAYQSAYLIDPVNGAPPVEPTDATRKLHLKIRTTDDTPFTGYPS